jgi:ATP-dependent helicase/DNAse subunit B
VVVPTRLQIRSWRRRLALTGGAIGVRLLTFDSLYAECLSAVGEVYTELSEPVQHRLIRAVVDDQRLTFFGPLTDRPGFVQIVQRLIGELKTGMISPAAFAQAVRGVGDEPRLRELAQVYTAYQSRLGARGWADREGLGWLAVEALRERAPRVARDWPLLVVDGFDDLTPVQLALLETLSGRVHHLVVTLTGTGDAGSRPYIHHRFTETRIRIERQLGVTATPLPAADRGPFHAPPLAHLESVLFCGGSDQVDGADAVTLIEAPDRASEVRAAFRWLKARLVTDGVPPAEVALLAREVGPYRSFILQIATEFSLPIRLVDGLPLRTNPAVAAFLDLLRLMLPAEDSDPQPALPRRQVVDAWRSPYFDWSALPDQGSQTPIGIEPADADALDIAARWGRVIGGHAQWKEALDRLVQLAGEPSDDEERGTPADLPTGAAAAALRDQFDRFVRRLTPPEGRRPYRDFVGWLENLIGSDPQLESQRGPLPAEPTALGIVRRAREAAQPTAERDVASLQALKDILRGLVWAEEAVEMAPVDFTRFFEELSGMVKATSYRLPVRPEREEIIVASATQVRGVPFQAVAILGMGEGEFPATLSEDPFLRDAERRHMAEQFNLPLRLSTESAEAEFFYEAITRPSRWLLLTRPRLADNGALWQASPFWEEVRRLVAVEPETLTSESQPPPDQVASWPELMESLAARPAAGEIGRWVRQVAPARSMALEAAADVFSLREAGVSDSRFDGCLRDQALQFTGRFGPTHVWSTSRLEAYRTCPFLFFVQNVLGLAPREEPTEGLNSRQLGNIYHRILRAVYEAPTVDDPTDLDQLRAALPEVAREILDQAPEQEGFRVTAWWDQTRAEIEENVNRSLEALAQMAGDFAPLQHEVPFGLAGQPPLIVRHAAIAFSLRGLIDRVDRAPNGQLRVIDYKTAGPWSYSKRAISEGEKLQLPLYALAARDALGLGEPTDGFYWHVQHARPSGFRLSRFDGGPEAAMARAVGYAWEAIRGAQGGSFVPRPPERDCPSYCPAADFCWHYQRGYGG